jgi:hypothetical protein
MICAAIRKITRTDDDWRRVGAYVRGHQEVRAMKKTVLTFGLLSGAVSSLMMVITLPFMDQVGFDGGMILGYTTMVLSFLLVFFGVRSYRDNVAGGVLSFGRAFSVGLLITVVSCICYVITWEIIYFNFAPDFLDKWAAYQIEKVRASGASQEAIEATARQMREFKVMYDKPLINAAFTFVEPLPVGLLVTLISAGVLRTRRPAPRAAMV